MNYAEAKRFLRLCKQVKQAGIEIQDTHDLYIYMDFDHAGDPHWYPNQEAAEIIAGRMKHREGDAGELR